MRASFAPRLSRPQLLWLAMATGCSLLPVPPICTTAPVRARPPRQGCSLLARDRVAVAAVRDTDPATAACWDCGAQPPLPLPRPPLPLLRRPLPQPRPSLPWRGRHCPAAAAAALPRLPLPCRGRRCPAAAAAAPPWPPLLYRGNRYPCRGCNCSCFGYQRRLPRHGARALAASCGSVRMQGRAPAVTSAAAASAAASATVAVATAAGGVAGIGPAAV